MAEPIRTAASNVVMRGPTPDVGDAWSEVDGRKTYLTWALTDDERAQVAAGANLLMGVYQYPMPPVSLDIDIRQALSDEAVPWVDRARNILKRIGPPTPPGYWFVSDDVWQTLQRVGALESGPSGSHVPRLVGRPLMVEVLGEDQAASTDYLVFVSGGRAYNENGPTDEAATPTPDGSAVSNGSLAGDAGSDGEARMGSERSDRSFHFGPDAMLVCSDAPGACEGHPA